MSLQLLIVDPDPVRRAALHEALRHLGECRQAASASEAHATFEDQMPDAVVCSFDTGVEGGPELCRQLRATDWGDEATFAVYGAPDPDVAARTRSEYGLDLVLAEGFRLPELVEPLARLRVVITSGQVPRVQDPAVAEPTPLVTPTAADPDLDPDGPPAETPSPEPAAEGDESWMDLLRAPVSTDSVKRLLTRKIKLGS